MLETSRRLLSFRKSIIRLLTEQFGYQYVDKREHRKKQADLRAYLHGPRVDSECLLYDMERINGGEAHYRVDLPCTLMHLMGLEQRRKRYNPKFKDDDQTPTPQEAIMKFIDMLYCGWEFKMTPGDMGYDPGQGGKEQYGQVNFVNWLKADQNRFTVYEGWRGLRNDGVAWDLILSVNHIPLVAVMMAPTTEGHRPCEEAYEEFRRQLDADPCLNTYLLCVVVSDGKTTLVGSPDDPPEWFFPWDPCDQVRAEAAARGVKESLLTFFALLEPHRLLAYLWSFARPVGEGEDLMRYVATSHQFEAVRAAAEHLKHGRGPGYGVLPQAEEQIRAYPFETNYDTTRQLLYDYMMQSGILDEPEEEPEDPADTPSGRFVVLPQMSQTMPEGVCFYRPSTILKSPLAD